MTHKVYYSVEEVAELLKLSRQGVFKRITSGNIRYQRVGKNTIIIPKTQFVDNSFAKESKVNYTKEKQSFKKLKQKL